MSRQRNNLRTSIGFENLESRRLMAGDISYSSSTKTLTITGDQLADRADVRFEGSKVKVDLYATRSNGSTDHHDQSKSIDSVRNIIFNGLAGNDAFIVTQGLLNSGVSLASVNLRFNAGDGNDSSDNQTGVPLAAVGGAGNDSLSGGSGIDDLRGGLGDDVLRGRAGNDSLFGEDGADAIYGDDGSDFLDGSTGGDYLNGGLGNDSLDGGDGNDGLHGEDGNDVLRGGLGQDILYAGLGNDTLLGGDGNDWMAGDDGNDVMYGGTGNDLLVGGNGDDRMYGEQGEDQLYGNNGNDVLDGGYDNALDFLNGGAGSDTFYSIRQRRFGFFNIVVERDTVGDLGAGDTEVRVSV